MNGADEAIELMQKQADLSAAEKEAEELCDKLHNAVVGHSRLAVVVALASMVITCPGNTGRVLRESLGVTDEKEFSLTKVIRGLANGA